MTDPKHEDHYLVLMDLVDHAVGTDPQPPKPHAVGSSGGYPRLFEGEWRLVRESDGLDFSPAAFIIPTDTALLLVPGEVWGRIVALIGTNPGKLVRLRHGLRSHQRGDAQLFRILLPPPCSSRRRLPPLRPSLPEATGRSAAQG